ncbi:indolepyruvate ferredoxin oxidoreductase family protein [Ruegeria marina]|uniref:Indolepyruvate ferredoxin oxidoreductase n=1 Tax=Ruegeria marina TaxID=639004 RepID=A0A1G6Y1J9_9RHOB|nr:indolepyruvate ferredoxin oxidoreductase family protein [Ruegeria marina]SDD84374.1 indolepyruvate ferredoxin oxidoreductase [Ruegeria marina]
MTQHMPTKRLEMTLEDRLNQEEGWVYMTGMQALVRLPLQQRQRDAAAGMNTGGYISGYRGSPLGTYDMNLWQAEKQLKANNIVFQPGINEDMAATAVWGSQQVGLFPGAKVDGVFSIWYGKAPGMDRSMDPLRHANLAGTNEKGGSLLLVGDDHGAKSSTLACYSDGNFVSAGMPLLAPANAQEVLDLGLHGIALSRYSSTLVGLKLVTDVVEGGGSVYVSPDSPKITLPEKKVPHPGITHFRPMMEQERLLWDVKLGLALDYARANGLNSISGSKKARIGIVSSGKAWQDLQQSLAGMGYRDGKIGNMDVRFLKVGMVWPLDADIVREFAGGLDVVLVIEEKRALLEDQIRSVLYGTDHAPRIVGKSFQGHGYGSEAAECAIPAVGEIDPGLITKVIARVVNETDPNCGIALPNEGGLPPALGGGAIRPPSFCAGCPHGRSTKVISGSRALAGIGCHAMAMLNDPMKTNSMSHMGGEGVGWLGQFPFTDEAHVFANMGDGTYFHSGLLAIRAAIAAKATITYKLLHNGFVSMTGGQPHDGEISPPMMVEQLKAEGVERIALVTDEPEKYDGRDFGTGVTVHPRTEMELAQQEMRGRKGVTVIIYDQPCATERRRLRKRGKWVDPDKRVFINPEVCEGCGDCSTVSGCMAIEPLETDLGRKRVINQSACNKDFSCVEGFCPSFVTVSGATPRKARVADATIDVSHLPLPPKREIDGSWSILVSGIGGAGVVTVGQTLAVAAHADGYFSSNLDITGLAQKYGAVQSHIKLAMSPEQMRATRIAKGEADALIGCDLVVAAGDETLSKLTAGYTVGVTDMTVVPTAEFSKNPEWQLNGDEQFERIKRVLGEEARGIEAQKLAERVMGDRLFANMLLTGAAWQQGGIPLSLEAIHRAIELNGVAVEQNKRAFDLGRLAIADPDATRKLSGETEPVSLDHHREPTLKEIVDRRAGELTAYRDAGFAKRYTDMIDKLGKAGLDDAALKAAARGYYKLMAVKDEWEVARLYAKPGFMKELYEAFEGDMELTFYFGAWPYGGKDPKTGKPVKGAVKGKTAMRFFGLMNRMRFLRGSLLDPFRNNDEARLARKLLADYEADLDFAMANASSGRAAEIAELLDLPEHIRGYGHVRVRHAEAAGKRRAELRNAIQNPQEKAA